MDFFQCRSIDEGQALIANYLGHITSGMEEVPLTQALGRIMAEDVKAAEDLPPFSRSTVDGFAVRSADTFGASESSPALLTLCGEISMGQQAQMALLPGAAATIPTGGMLPAGADAVVMIEYTEQYGDGNVMVLKMAAPGDHLVAKGDDIRQGAIIVKKGQKLAPQHIGALAACGAASVKVTKQVQVAVLSTGDELVDISQPIADGQIRDVNSYALGAMLADWGCSVVNLGIVKDSFEQFYEALQRAAEECQLVVISGGSSVGARDYTARAINALGSPGVLFHGLAIKPGKPTIFGMAGAVPVFGLPGHPVAAMTVCRQLVKGAVNILQGQREQQEGLMVIARLSRNLPSVPGRDDYINVRLCKQQDQYIAVPILGKSGMISTMSEADGIIRIPAVQSGLYQGDWVEVMLTKRSD